MHHHHHYSDPMLCCSLLLYDCGQSTASTRPLRGASNNANSRWLRPLLRPLLRVRVEGNLLMEARAVGLAATGASLADASFTTPHGMTVELLGNFLWCL